MFRQKELLFRGSKDRLHRMVKRQGGEFLENQRFEILWQPSLFATGFGPHGSPLCA